MVNEFWGGAVWNVCYFFKLHQVSLLLSKRKYILEIFLFLFW